MGSKKWTTWSATRIGYPSMEAAKATAEQYIKERYPQRSESETETVHCFFDEVMGQWGYTVRREGYYKPLLEDIDD